MSNTVETWRQRVFLWRKSGKTAEAFSAGRGWSPRTLRWWSSRLKREAHASVPVVRMAQVVRAASAAPDREGTIVVELLEVRTRITIDRGAEGDLVATVLEALAGGPRVDR